MRQFEHGDHQPESEQMNRSRGFAVPGADSKVVITWIFLGINILVWLLMQLVGGFFNEDADLLLRFGAMFGPLIAVGEYWRFFTAMFLHAGIVHLLFNCFALFIFGRIVEALYGSARFTTIYLLAGLSGGILSYMFNRTAIAVGASGAIFGIVGAFAAYFIVHRGALGEMGRRNLSAILTVVAINFVIGLLIPGIDNWAHLGGLIGGFIMGVALAPRYLYELIGAPNGLTRRVSAQIPLKSRWLAVPAFAALLAGAVWFIGGNVSDLQQSQILVVQAERLLEEGSVTEALEHIERAIELDASSAAVFYMRGKILASIGSTENAKSDLSAALRLPGLNPAQRDDAISILVSLP